MGVPIGQHLIISKELKTDDFPNGELVQRKYTPITSFNTRGIIELLVKIYRKNEHPKFPGGGKLTSWMEGLKVGDRVQMQGPIGRLLYHGNGKVEITIPGEPQKFKKQYKRISMIGGGTGLTPLFQLIQAISDNDNDHTQISLLFANKSVKDILMDDVLDQYKQKGLKVSYTLDQANENWKGYVGFINEQMLIESCFEARDDTLVCICGPPPMCTLVTGLLKQIGHKETNIFKF